VKTHGTLTGQAVTRRCGTVGPNAQGRSIFAVPQLAHLFLYCLVAAASAMLPRVAFAQVPGVILYEDGSRQEFFDLVTISCSHCSRQGLVLDYRNSLREVGYDKLRRVDVRRYEVFNDYVLENAILHVTTVTGLASESPPLSALNSILVKLLDELTGEVVEQQIYFARSPKRLNIRSIVFDAAEPGAGR